ncbi:P-loop NTPase fold protein [uncultured Thiodictyon sp.]|uniref:P-loop NTPase fold protein n=1 Tax=uncultured Thiodictyon sp. TaxID=1846217 RepID=UPI0025CDFB16|nr:P-loop NTPase fold protein [uncultured Thiodictyon sp.]
MAFNRQAGLAAAKLLEHVADAAMSLYVQKPVQLARGLTDAVRARRQAEEDQLTRLSDGQRFHLLFEDAITQVLSACGDTAKPAVGARVLIFVDDLDRSEGEVIVRLLEIIKLYLGTRRCVFVLGLDDNAVLAALHKHRSESAEANREYLEKLFQAMIGVPLPNAAGVRSSLVAQLRLHGIPCGPGADAAIQADTDAGRAQLAADIELLLEPNPRKIKNFANGLCAAWAMHGCAGWIGARPEEDRRFVLYHYLRQYHRPVWRLLERQHWVLHLLWATLTGAADTDIARDRLPGDRADQRLLEEIFYRAFSHILPTRQSENEERHGRESLEDAVRQFNERRDRKRSDENFRILFRQLIGADTELDRRHLHLPLDDEPQGGEP